MKKVVSGITTAGFTIVSAALFIVISIVFFFLHIWVIKVAAGWAGFTVLDGNWVVLTAGLLAAASTIAAAVRR